MATPTTSYKRRTPGRKAEDIRIVWKAIAPDTVFGAQALADLEASIATLDEASEEVNRLTLARSAAQKNRDEKTAALSQKVRVIVRGVQAHPEHGEDSPLYRAMGYIPLSERRSGLTRRNPADGGDTAGNEETAA